MKVTCEIDTETKETKVLIDGNEVSVLEFTLGHYVTNGCGDSQEYKCSYISLTQGDVNNRYTQSISFDDREGGSYSESRTVMSVPKSVGKAFANILSAAKLGNVLVKNK